MQADDLRFYAPETPEQELGLARARVRERRHGVRLVSVLFGGCALPAAALGAGARWSAGAARLLVPVLVVLAMGGAALAIVAASALLWQARLRRLERQVAIPASPSRRASCTMRPGAAPRFATPVRRARRRRPLGGGTGLAW